MATEIAKAVSHGIAPLAQFATDEFQRRLDAARMLRARQPARFNAPQVEHQLACWLAVAVQLGAPLPQAADLLECYGELFGPGHPATRACAADAIASPADRAAELTRALETAQRSGPDRRARQIARLRAALGIHTPITPRPSAAPMEQAA